jgi:carbamoyltransferase
VKIFEDIWIQPAAVMGGAIGAAYIAYHQHANQPLQKKTGRDLQKGSYLGPQYSNDETREFLSHHSLPYHFLEDGKLLDVVTDLIIKEKIIGWFQGRMEFGPRALGSRTIIGDARSPQMQKKMNLKIKFREGFRPFAPSVLAEKVSEWFEIDRESPYMLLVAEVKRKAKKNDSGRNKSLGD